MHWGCPFDSKSLLRGAVLPILQMEKLRLRKLESDPKAPHCGARVLGVCVFAGALWCAHTAGAAVCCLCQAVFGLG